MTITIGVDEVGRGCLWGPVVISAVASFTDDVRRVDGVRDSKTVKSEKARHALAVQVMEIHPHVVTLASASVIDQFGINPAQNACATRAVGQLIDQIVATRGPCIFHVVYDGDPATETPAIDLGIHTDLQVYCKHIPQADATIYEVSAASLVAKSYRDNWCHQYVLSNPAVEPYGLDTNFGYGAPKHEKAIAKLGLHREHRKSFCKRHLK